MARCFKSGGVTLHYAPELDYPGAPALAPVPPGRRCPECDPRFLCSSCGQPRGTGVLCRACALPSIIEPQFAQQPPALVVAPLALWTPPPPPPGTPCVFEVWYKVPSWLGW